MGEGGSFDELVDAARRGEQRAFGELYRELQAPLLGFLVGLEPRDAEDLAADAWIDAAKQLPAFEGDGSEFRRLLFTIARRRAIDHARKRGRRRTDAVDPFRFPDAGPAGDAADLVADDQSSRLAIERIGRLLPRSQTEVLILRVVVGLTVSEVAEVIGRKPQEVSVLQARALRRLASALGNPARAPDETAQGTRTN